MSKGNAKYPHSNSMPVKLTYTFAEYVHRNYENKFYAKAANLTRVLTKGYNDALKKYDVLLTPTLPTKPIKLPTKSDTMKGKGSRSNI